MYDAPDPVALTRCFLPADPCAAAELCTRGHINTTFFVTVRSGARFVLQRINPQVFPDPRVVARNVADVCAHLAPSGLVPGLVPDAAGRLWTEDATGDVWRLARHVPGRSLAFLADLDQARAAGGAFAGLQRALADFDGTRLAPAIPFFHDLTWRLGRMDAVLAAPPPGTFADRRGEARSELAFVEARRGLAREGASDRLPGVIHGDCKVNNLLFDETDRVTAVVDLDTVMVGSRAWDFGDLVRSAASTAAEDDPSADLSMSLFRAIAAGFVEELGVTLSSVDRAGLVTACRYMTFMLGLRFLIDFLEGDVYFRAAHPRHNLVRARAQFSLVARMEQRERQMLHIAREV